MQSNRLKNIRIAGLILSCLLVLAGIMVLRQQNLIAGLIFILFGGAVFGVTIIINEKAPAGEDETSGPVDFKHVLPYLIFGIFPCLSLVLFVWVTFGMHNSSAVNRWMDAGWIASMLFAVIAMLMAVRWRLPSIKKVKEWFSTNKVMLLILLGILAVAFFLRIFLIASHPFPWSGDEASVGIEGRRILSGEISNFFETGWSGQPNWSFTPTALALRLFGENIFALRIMSVLEGTLAVLFLFLLARELFDNTIALLAAGFLAAYPIQVQFSRIGVNNVVDSLMITLVLWLVFRALRRDKFENYMLAGLISGLTFYSYTGTRLVLAIAVGVLIYTCIRRKGFFKAHIPHLSLYLLGMIIAIGPIAWVFIRQPALFMTRIGQESIFHNDWLSLQSVATGRSDLAIVWKQFTNTILVFISNPAIGMFFNSSRPYLTVLGAVFFLFGMAFIFAHILEVRSVAILGWFWSVIFLGGVLTLNPPANTRLVMTSPAVALLIAVGLVKFGSVLTRMRFLNLRWQAILSALVILVLAAQNITFYFGVYRTHDLFGDANGELAQQVGFELKRLGPSYDYYLFGQPRIFTDFPTTKFLAPVNPRYDLDANSIDTLDINEDTSALFVATPDNLELLQQVVAKYPGGKWEVVKRTYEDEVLYYAYVLN